MTDDLTPEGEFAPRTDLSELKAAADEIRSNMAQLLVGQEKTLDLLLVALLADGHVLLEGVPGIAKTLIAKLVARSLEVHFSRVQFTPDLMPSDVLGTSVYNQKSGDFEFRPGPVFTQVLLIDEINRAPAKTQAALFEVMEERQVTMDGHKHLIEAPFFTVATQNPIEQEGTYRLPEAQLDRFLFRIKMGYPSLEEEELILKKQMNLPRDPLGAIQPVLKADRLLSLRRRLAEIRLEPNLINYIARIVDATRHDPSLYLGASPRASIALLRSSRAWAALQGRDFVTPDDVKFLTGPVLAHRVLLTPEREMEGLSVEEVVQRGVEKIEVPR